jgi:hypothetical protein
MIKRQARLREPFALYSERWSNDIEPQMADELGYDFHGSILKLTYKEWLKNASISQIA